jgi:hypothetical protein
LNDTLEVLPYQPKGELQMQIQATVVKVTHDDVENLHNPSISKQEHSITLALRSTSIWDREKIAFHVSQENIGNYKPNAKFLLTLTPVEHF